MPEIPKAKPSVGYSSLPKPDRSAISRGGAILGRGLSQFGKSVGQAWETISRERDMAQAHDAVMRFNDLARGKYSELKKREGANAWGVLTEYQSWFDKEAPAWSGRLKSAGQRELFNRTVIGRRQRDLDSLSAHEAQEHKRHIDSQAISAFTSAMQDASIYSDDPERIEQLSNRISQWVDMASPGMDNTVKKIEYDSRLKIAALNTQIAKDPVKAKEMLERWRPSLGPLANSIGSAVDKEFYYFNAKTNHPGSFNAQYDYVAKLSGVDEDTKRQVMGRIEADQAEAAERERQANARHSDNIKLNDLDAITDYFEGRLTPQALSALANTQKISKQTAKYLFEQFRNPVKNDEPLVAGELWSQVEFGGTGLEASLKVALEKGQIKPETYIAMKKTAANKEMQRAAARLGAAMRPGLIDRFRQDKNIRYADAQKRLFGLVAAGMPPGEAEAVVRREFLGHIRRTTNGIVTPSRLNPEKKGDLGALEQSRLDTAAAYANGEMDESEYKYQIDLIEQLLELAGDASRLDQPEPNTKRPKGLGGEVIKND